MTSRPRRSAATRASASISVHARWADASDKGEGSSMSSRRSGRASGVGATREMPSSSPDESVTVRTSRSTRGAGRRDERFDGGEIVHGSRNRGGRKNYVIDSSPDDDDDNDDDDEQEVEEDEDAEADDVEEPDEDAEGEEMDLDAEGEDVDAEGEEDAEEEDVDLPAPAGPRAGHTIRLSQPAARFATRAAASKLVIDAEDEDENDDDDDELSDPADSDDGDQTLGFADEIMADEDAEGEEIEVAGEGEEEEEDEEDAEDMNAEGEAVGGDAGADSDNGTREGTPDLTKMTKRQRARFEDEPQEYMKLSDEVQVKKHFTAEELSMRRQEMARRRRNLSEKRTEEVKMETINKLLKKQAPKINKKAAAAAARADSVDEESQRADPTLIRWVNNRSGSQVSIPQEIIAAPVGQVFTGGRVGLSRKLVQEVV